MLTKILSLAVLCLAFFCFASMAYKKECELEEEDCNFIIDFEQDCSLEPIEPKSFIGGDVQPYGKAGIKFQPEEGVKMVVYDSSTNKYPQISSPNEDCSICKKINCPGSCDVNNVVRAPNTVTKCGGLTNCSPLGNIVYLTSEKKKPFEPAEGCFFIYFKDPIKLDKAVYLNIQEKGVELKVKYEGKTGFEELDVPKGGINGISSVKDFKNKKVVALKVCLPEGAAFVALIPDNPCIDEPEFDLSKCLCKCKCQDFEADTGKGFAPA